MDLYFDEEEEEAIAKLLEEIEQKQLSRMVSEKNEAYASPQPCASLSPYQEQGILSFLVIPVEPKGEGDREALP